MTQGDSKNFSKLAAREPALALGGELDYVGMCWHV